MVHRGNIIILKIGSCTFQGVILKILAPDYTGQKILNVRIHLEDLIHISWVVRESDICTVGI